MAFDALIKIIQKMREKNPSFGKRLAEAESLGRWETAVGNPISKHTRAIRVESKILYVEVDHPIWKNELQYRKRQILELLNKGSPSEDAGYISDIFFLDPRG